ncbi:MAG: amidohydrolase family protein [Acidimicrobiia bacterium]
MTADVVIRGGTVIDGTGAPGVRADVAVAEGVITEIGARLDGRRELDATDQVVAPGFVDVHTHYDAQVFWDPALTPSCWHGVTTVVAGNCGFTLAPCRPEHRELLVHTLEHVEDMNFDTLQAGVPWDFETFPEYLDSVERRGTLLNYACYIGHTAVRLWVMGEDGYERAATDTEIAEMQRVVREAVELGAAGFATSSSPTHSGDGGRPVPSRVADRAELAALVAPLRDLGKGVIAALPGEKVVHDDLYAIQREVGRPLTWTALLTLKGLSFASDMAARNAEERATGADVWPQISVRELTFSQNMMEPFAFNMIPAFGELMGAPREEKLARFRDPAWRARATAEMDSAKIFRPRWEETYLAESSTHPELLDRSVADLAAQQGSTPLDVVLDLSCEENLETRFRSTLANNDPDGIADLLQQDGLVLGLSDAGAHVSQLCDACAPTDLLGNWVREREVISLERAVRKLSGEAADLYSMEDRGYLKPGFAADIAVFDPATVAPGGLRRVRDFPAGGERLVADSPAGMTHVLVNGTPIRVDGEPVAEALAQRPGKLLRT